jgi:hypothetical protein
MHGDISIIGPATRAFKDLSTGTNDFELLSFFVDKLIQSKNDRQDF